MTTQNDVSRHLASSIDSSPDGVLMESSERIVYMNAAYARFLGYDDPGALIGQSIEAIAAPADLERLAFYGNERRAGRPAPDRYEFLGRRRDQSLIALAASVSVSLLGDTSFITTVVRPVPREVSPVDLEQKLSERETEVLRMLLQGRRNKTIAYELGISQKTVATHRTRLFRKLGVEDAWHLFQLANVTGGFGAREAGATS